MVAALNRGKAGHSATTNDTKSTDSSVHNASRGAQIVQTNTLSTPMFLALMVMLSVSIALSVVALYTSQLAERKAALAHNHADVATAKEQHLEDVMTIRGIVIPPMPKQENE